MGNCWDRDKTIPSVPLEETVPLEMKSTAEMKQTTELKQSTTSLKKITVPKRKKIKETAHLKKSKSDQGFKQLNDYVIKQLLGEGSFGKVKLAEKEDKQYAVKILKKSRLKKKRDFVIDKDGSTRIKTALDDVQKEIAIMKKLKHPNIVRLYEVIDNPQSDKLYLFMEFAQRGEIISWNEDEQIFEKICEQEIDESFLISIMQGIVKGVYQLHTQGIVHRDIKPQNILFDQDWNAKIADFGVSEITKGDDEMGSTQGTYHFMAPEAFEEHFCGKAVDIWAIGVSLYCYAFLQLPFNGDDLEEIKDIIKNKEVTFPKMISKDLERVIKGCLHKDPNQRITIQDLIKDEWIGLKEEDLQSTEIYISNEEIEQAFSIGTFVLIKGWVNKWKHSHSQI